MSTMTEEIRPPEALGPVAWMRKNLFSSWFNSLLSVVSLGFILWAIQAALRWAIFSADWRPVTSSPLLYLVGQYPREQLWRLGVGVLMTTFLIGLSWRKWGGIMRTFAFLYMLFLGAIAIWPSQGASFTMNMRFALVGNLILIPVGYWVGGFKWVRSWVILVGWLAALVIGVFLMGGSASISWLPVVPTGMWGGLLVTMILAVGGIVLSFPIGVLLALGRRSSLPVVSIFSTIFIEVVRGVPLIGILFLSSLILPLFLPPDVRIDRLLRALMGMTLFSAAYMAENVRGGLAAVPNGQIEAAKALGHNNFQIMLLIVLPQALRAVIPPIVGQFISLFKDTTLASGVAVLELLSVGRSIVQANPEYIRSQMEMLVFIAAVFWVFSYLMSFASQRLEVALGVGER
jgi:general L-amino acid transport system permease protein